MPRRTTDYRGLAESSRVRLLRAIQLSPGSTLRQLTERTGIHENTARDHLRTLEQEGLITTRPLRSGRRGRPATTYTAVDDTSTNEAAHRRVERALQKRRLLRTLLPEHDRTGGLAEAAVHQLDVLQEHLDDTGFDPEVDPRRMVVGLVPCPFHRIVDEDQELACAAHARLLQDTLAQVPGPVRLEELRPFVTPQSCEVRLAYYEASE